MAARPVPGARRSQGRRGHDRPGEPAAGDDQSGLRESILAATERLLAERSFADLAVSEILTAAGVSRGSFYFYFDSKHDVLAELVRRAVSRGHDAAASWLAHPDDPEAALRAGITAGAELWRASAPVLRAIVENWRTDPRLTALWLEQMQTFTDATMAQISAEPATALRLAGQDVAALAAALTWLGERLYYLAAIGTPPFDDQDTLVETLLFLWTSALAGPPGTVSR
jgi:TetR/AcrR family transcriptional regulator, ethionamide resistance regulator